MALCPAGHESQTNDYCDTCGAVIGGAPVTAAPPEGTAVLGGEVPGAAAGGEASCPQCGAQRAGRFCEECGFDYELAALLPPMIRLDTEAPELNGRARRTPEPVAPPEAAASPEPAEPEAAAPPDFTTPPDPAASPETTRLLSIVVTADREYYQAQVDRGDIVEAEFPFPKYPGQRRFVLERAEPVRIGRASAGRGIAVEIDLTGPPLDPAVSHLHAQLLRGPGGWLLVDLGSANGTRLNGAEQPVPVETEIPVKAGDRIHVGVWTTLTLEDA